MFNGLPRLSDDWSDADQAQYLTERLEKVTLENDTIGELKSFKRVINII